MRNRGGGSLFWNIKKKGAVKNCWGGIGATLFCRVLKIRERKLRKVRVALLLISTVGEIRKKICEKKKTMYNKKKSSPLTMRAHENASGGVFYWPVSVRSDRFHFFLTLGHIMPPDSLSCSMTRPFMLSRGFSFGDVFERLRIDFLGRLFGRKLRLASWSKR